MSGYVRADISALAQHVNQIKWNCDAMVDASRKFSSSSSDLTWSDNNSEYVVEIYERVAKTIEGIIQTLDGVSVILNKQIEHLEAYASVQI